MATKYVLFYEPGSDVLGRAANPLVVNGLVRRRHVREWQEAFSD